MFTCIRDSVGGCQVAVIRNGPTPLATIALQDGSFNGRRLPPALADQIAALLTTMQHLHVNTGTLFNALHTLVEGFDERQV